MSEENKESEPFLHLSEGSDVNPTMASKFFENALDEWTTEEDRNTIIRFGKPYEIKKANDYSQPFSSSHSFNYPAGYVSCFDEGIFREKIFPINMGENVSGEECAPSSDDSSGLGKIEISIPGNQLKPYISKKRDDICWECGDPILPPDVYPTPTPTLNPPCMNIRHTYFVDAFGRQHVKQEKICVGEEFSIEGDGDGNEFPNTSFSIKYLREGSVIVTKRTKSLCSSFDFDKVSSESEGVEFDNWNAESPDTCPLPGCTDPSACNYNEFASCEDGTCEYSDCSHEDNPHYAPTPLASWETPTPTPTATPVISNFCIKLTKCMSKGALYSNGQWGEKEEFFIHPYGKPVLDFDGNILHHGDVLKGKNPGGYEPCWIIEFSYINGSDVSLEPCEYRNSGDQKMWINRGYPYHDLIRGFSCPDNLQDNCERDCTFFLIGAKECACEGEVGRFHVQFKSKEHIPSRHYFYKNGKCYVTQSSRKKENCNYNGFNFEEISLSETNFASSDPCGSCHNANGVCPTPTPEPTPTPDELLVWSHYSAEECLEEDYLQDGYYYNGCDNLKWGKGRTSWPMHPVNKGVFKSSFGESISDGYICGPAASEKIDKITEFTGTYEEYVADSLPERNISKYDSADGCGCRCNNC